MHQPLYEADTAANESTCKKLLQELKAKRKPPPIRLPSPMKPAINFALHCCRSSQNLRQMMQIPKNNASFICSNKTKRGLESCPKANKKYEVSVDK